MSTIDWIVMCGFTGFIVFYGAWKTRKTKNVDDYLRTGKSSSWWVVALSIMATQASAITFLSTPGQAYVDGMRFVQFYLGLPIAMIILSITTVPIYSKLNVYTAYEYLEKRFDLKNRLLGSVLFLSQRGLAAGFTIYAPALILSVILGWELNITIVLIGIMVIIYTSIGGTNAVNKTHVLQMIIITVGMFASFFMIYILLPKDISVIDAAFIAGKLGKLNAIDFSFNLNDRYTFWSGIIGGTFLMLSYFGTDQSQVARYLAAKNITQSRMGLLVNGIVKIPMQFIILFIGAMVFVFFQFVTPPLFFNPVETEKVKSGLYSKEYSQLENEFELLQNQKREKLRAMLDESSRSSLSSSENINNELTTISKNEQVIKASAKEIIKKNNPDADTNDTNYIFITYIVNYLPIGLIGLLLAAIIAASMSSTSAELNSLASTSLIDIYKRLINKNGSDNHYLKFSKYATVGWGIYAIIFALLASELGSLIEAVNILGSLVYGTILGIFLVAFYTKKISGDSVFISAVVAEAVVIYSFVFTSIPFLWYNVIGCAIVIVLSFIINPILPSKENR
ncbi:MAG: sodium:solute symporter [Ignavibacteriales bacterium]|nr:sodium:solute symporter [Ignavibacteriales bacterium]